MRRWLLRSFAALLIAGSYLLPASAPAQGTTGGDGAPEKVERTPVLQYAVAAIFTIAVMLVVCIPSRKG
jgi:hypothetical protein